MSGVETKQRGEPSRPVEGGDLHNPTPCVFPKSAQFSEKEEVALLFAGPKSEKSVEVLERKELIRVLRRAREVACFEEVAHSFGRKPRSWGRGR